MHLNVKNKNLFFPFFAKIHFQFFAAAAVLVSGAGGGVSGPTGIWMSLAARLADAGVPTLRLDYRQPAKTDPCVRDILAAMAELNKRYGASRFGLVGWSFGTKDCEAKCKKKFFNWKPQNFQILSAPVFTLATRLCHSPNQSQLQIGAVAVVAPQTADAFGIRDCPPMPVLLVHGSNDRCLSPMCSLSLKKAYDAAARTEKVESKEWERKREFFFGIFPSLSHFLCLQRIVTSVKFCCSTVTTIA